MPIKLPSFRPRRDSYPADLWTKCPSCSEMIFNKQLEKNDRICPTCGHHFRLSAAARLEMLLDQNSFRERDAGLQSVDPLGFVDQKSYPDRVAAAQSATGLRDAAVRGFGSIDGTAVSICVMDFGFMGGSMGAVVGEKVTRAAEDALANRVPLLIVSASGGARMQEGTLALMQLAKTVAALERLRAARVPYISVMSDPTTGGVFASYAVLGDVNLAEPNALIGFAGARVAAGTIAQELPPGFQRSEFLFEHGFVDRVIERRALRTEIAGLLRFLRVPDVPLEAARPIGPVGTLLSAVGSVGGAAVGAVGAVGGVAAGAVGAVGGAMGNAVAGGAIGGPMANAVTGGVGVAPPRQTNGTNGTNGTIDGTEHDGPQGDEARGETGEPSEPSDPSDTTSGAGAAAGPAAATAAAATTEAADG